MARFHDSQEISFNDGTASEKGRERGTTTEVWEEAEEQISSRSGGSHANRQFVVGRQGQKGRATKALEVVERGGKSMPPPSHAPPPPRKKARSPAREESASGTSSGESSGELTDECPENDDDEEEEDVEPPPKLPLAHRSNKKSKTVEKILPPKAPKKKARPSAEEGAALSLAVRRSASPDLDKKKETNASGAGEKKGKAKAKPASKKRKQVLSISSDEDESEEDTDDEDDPLFRGLPAQSRQKIKGRYKKKAESKYKKKLQKVGLILIKSSSR